MKKIRCKLKSRNASYYSVKNLVLQVGVQKYKAQDIQNYNFAFSFAWVWNLVSHSEVGT